MNDKKESEDQKLLERIESIDNKVGQIKESITSIKDNTISLIYFLFIIMIIILIYFIFEFVLLH